ncbi:ImmA/IrrE family metallo-endopeptidase [Bacillus suaedae]|uniref:ImmA/IrrE family metallo-endopeptidase n=1 Tax=Halalkalibacter suaedae TaxID=2822140 RepID=A0A940WTE1_9BACI|nr:ImmA/IrrE family metallo-endopeptidase [Bacillus suaedae]MBP3950297.1 ImmA/IrrE family metallo-endopeptidase [Bacillus suaedae]
MRYAPLREKQITEIMRMKGIRTVSDLTTENICIAFDIDLHFEPRRSRCIFEDDFAVVILDSRLPRLQQRGKFFHELSHIIAHVGDQKRLNEPFKDLQETQAYWISLYTSMPRYLFEPAAIKYQSIQKLQQIFDLPEDMIIARFESIKRERKRQEFQYKMARSESKRRPKSLQPGQVYDSTLSILNQLKNQVGEERLSYEVKRLL